MPLLLPFFSQDNLGVRTFEGLAERPEGFGFNYIGFGFHIFGGDFF